MKKSPGLAAVPAAAPLRGTRAGLLSLLRSVSAAALLPALLALALWLGFFYRLGDVPLFDVDEGAFSEATREMLERGDFLTTYLNGRPRFDKPILAYWLQALSVSLLGVHELAFRLPSALAAAGWVGALFAFTRRQADRATAGAGALIAATTLGVVVIGRAATADALLNLLLALAMFDIFRYLREPLARTRYRAFLWIALGLLAKGPIALLIPFAASAAAFALHGKARLWARAVADPLGWLILLFVAGPWYLLEYLEQGRAFVDGFFLRHNVERFMTPLQGHRGNPLYYAAAALLLLLPHTGLWIRILPRLRQFRATPLDTFLWCWFGFVLLFFSVAATKLPHYLLYGVTPLFVLMARHRHLLESRALAFAPPLLLLALVGALPYLLRFYAPRIGNPYVREALAQDVFSAAWHAQSFALLLAMLALAVLPPSVLPRVATWHKLIAAGLLCQFALAGLVLPALGQLQQGPVKEAAALARQANARVVTWHFNVPSFSVYRGQATEAATLLRPGDVVLTRLDKFLLLQEKRGLRLDVLYRKGGVVLARVHPAEAR